MAVEDWTYRDVNLGSGSSVLQNLGLFSAFRGLWHCFYFLENHYQKENMNSDFVGCTGEE